MNNDTLKGKWKQLKGDVRERWGDLTDDELEQIEGNRENLEGKIQEKYGIAKEEAKDQVNKFLDFVDSKVN